MNFWQNLILVFVGVVMASTSYFLKTFIFEAVVQYRRVVGKIRNRIKFFANTLTSPKADPSKSSKGSVACRELSCDLEEAYFAIPFRGILAHLHIVQTEEAVDTAARSLISLSNSAFDGEPLKNNDQIQKIADSLWRGKGSDAAK